eukprot:GHVN01074055.1.p1 GENE.GHVN01074055.1~~GHVN01074055.1.p1  ORF type:complete len:284 (-),score=69.72 GHVN01074055.1:71-922(-)
MLPRARQGSFTFVHISMFAHPLSWRPYGPRTSYCAALRLALRPPIAALVNPSNLDRQIKQTAIRKRPRLSPIASPGESSEDDDGDRVQVTTEPGHLTSTPTRNVRTPPQGDQLGVGGLAIDHSMMPPPSCQHDGRRSLPSVPTPLLRRKEKRRVKQSEQTVQEGSISKDGTKKEGFEEDILEVASDSRENDKGDMEEEQERAVAARRSSKASSNSSTGGQKQRGSLINAIQSISATPTGEAGNERIVPEMAESSEGEEEERPIRKRANSKPKGKGKGKAKGRK